MSLSNRIKRYAKENFTETLHTTLNPEGPGVVRIHMIPPLCDGDDVEAAQELQAAEEEEAAATAFREEFSPEPAAPAPCA